jgi:hypothetical protein
MCSAGINGTVKVSVTLELSKCVRFSIFSRKWAISHAEFVSILNWQVYALKAGGANLNI